MTIMRRDGKMAHLALDKQTRRQYLKAKRRIALNVAKPSDMITVVELYKKTKTYDSKLRSIA